MKGIPTQKISGKKVATGLVDIATILAFDQIGRLMTMNPALMLTSGVLTVFLGRWRKDIVTIIVGNIGSMHNRNKYSFRPGPRTASKYKPVILVEQQTVN